MLEHWLASQSSRWRHSERGMVTAAENRLFVHILQPRLNEWLGCSDPNISSFLLQIAGGSYVECSLFLTFAV